MPVVHIRVIEVKCSETRNRVNYFFVNFYINSKPNDVQKLSIDIAQKNSKVLSSCSKSICLDVDNHSQNQLYVQLKRHRMIISDDDIGKVVIPLKWFPRRKVVREWFPLTSAGKLRKTLMDNINDMQNSSQNKNIAQNNAELPEYNDGSENLMLLLDVHIAKKKDKPFNAPFSSMRVLPSWKKPLLLQGSEFPPVPPIAYIVGRNPDSTKDDTIPVHQSYVIMLQSDQPNQNNSAINNPSNMNSNNNNINQNINNSNINHPNINNNPNNNNTNQPVNPTPPQMQTTINSQDQEPQTQSELQPYFPAPQPNVRPPADNLILPPFMQGSEEGLNVTLVTEYMSPYSHPNDMNQIFATDNVPNVFYPQVNIINEEEDDDDDDDDDINDNDIKDEDEEDDNDSENNNNNDDDDLKDDNE